MSQSESEPKYRKLFEFRDPQQAAEDQTTDTGFSETPASASEEKSFNHEQTQLFQPETRTRTMTARGFEYHLSIKERLGLDENKAFGGHVDAFLTSLATLRDTRIIVDDINKLAARAENTQKALDEWLQLVSDTDQATIIANYKEGVKTSFEKFFTKFDSFNGTMWRLKLSQSFNLVTVSYRFRHLSTHFISNIIR